MCKDVCGKIYTGDNLKYLEGADKIPAYLSIFLEHMKKQGEEFKIAMCRQLRQSTERLETLLAEVPHSVFYYIHTKYSMIIEKGVNQT